MIDERHRGQPQIAAADLCICPDVCFYNVSAGFEAGIEGGGEGGAVEVATDEYEFDHAVTIFFIPVAAESRSRSINAISSSSGAVAYQ